MEFGLGLGLEFGLEFGFGLGLEFGLEFGLRLGLSGRGGTRVAHFR